MAIRVEFFGIPRRRAGVAEWTIAAERAVPLSRVLRQLADDLPGWAADCLDGECLRSGYAANVDGERFVSDPETLVPADARLLILSADAGG